MPDGGDVQAGGNQSVHWKVRAAGRSEIESGKPGLRTAQGKVSVPGGPANIGAARGERGFFVLTLRFADRQAARQELENALASISSRKKGAFATLKVPAKPRLRPTDDLPWEVKVAW
jgi:hypothetical protein